MDHESHPFGLGVAAAYGYSVVATVAPGLFPSNFMEHGRIGVYFDAAAVIRPEKFA